jgi:hypothetical protein
MAKETTYHRLKKENTDLKRDIDTWRALSKLWESRAEEALEDCANEGVYFKKLFFFLSLGWIFLALLSIYLLIK